MEFSIYTSTEPIAQILITTILAAGISGAISASITAIWTNRSIVKRELWRIQRELISELDREFTPYVDLIPSMKTVSDGSIPTGNIMGVSKELEPSKKEVWYLLRKLRYFANMDVSSLENRQALIGSLIEKLINIQSQEDHELWSDRRKQVQELVFEQIQDIRDKASKIKVS